MKRKIIVIILILMVIIFLFNILSHKKIDLNGVYKHNTDINNIEIYVKNISTNKEVLITDKKDVNVILNSLMNTNVDISFDNEDIIGGFCRLVILNTKNNKKVNINIGRKKIVINGNKIYKTNDNIFDNIKDIIIKYDTNMVF